MFKVPNRITNPNDRFSSGVPRLDFLLKGGLYKGALYVVQGAPGLGKTVLANQLCFERAKEGQPVVFLSLLAESTGRLLTYLRPFEFVDEAQIGERIEYASAYKALKDGGLPRLLDLIKQSVTKRKAKLFVLDGLDSVQALAPSEAEFREFVYSLQAFASLTGCTTVLLSPRLGNGHAGFPRPEHAICDGLIELSEYTVGPRAIREIQVLKFRGSDFLKGRHEIEVNQQGLVIHPRTEVQFGRNPPAPLVREKARLQFGVKRFDEMLHGGIYSGSMSSIVGAPGTGKTSLGISFLAEGARRGEAGVYFGFYETPDTLLEKADGLGIPLRKGVESGLIEMQWQQAVEGAADGLAERLLERIRSRKEKRIRVFVDGMSGFRKALAYPERFGVFLSALTNELRNIGATTIYSEETEIFSSQVEIPNKELGSIVDNVIFLRYVELRSQLHRLVSILKMRESAYESAIREFLITEKGIQVSESFRSAESVLTGLARVRGGQGRAGAPGSRARKSRKGKR